MTAHEEHLQMLLANADAAGIRLHDRLNRALDLLIECDRLDDEMEARALGRAEDMRGRTHRYDGEGNRCC
jgi:hypothetical protein